MIDATLTMLRARHDEMVAATGVIAAMFADDPMQAVERLECARDAARECAQNAGRDQRKKQIYRHVESYADDLINPVRKLAERCGPSAAMRTIQQAGE